MISTQSRDFQIQYQTCKLKVKQWEESFKKKHGRTPQRDDIRKSSSSVKEYYRTYYKLKTKLLEEDILGNSSDVNIPLHKSKSDCVLKEHTNILPDFGKTDNSNSACKELATDEKPSKENISLEKSNADKVKSEPKTWGSHLNRNKTSSSSDPVKSQTFNDSISEKLFEGTKFKKRNPRKSISFNKSRSTLSVVSNDETVSSKSDNRNESFQMGFSPCPDVHDKTNPDQLFSVENDCSPNIKALIMTTKSLSPLFAQSEKYRIVQDSKKEMNQPVSLIQKLAAEPKAMKSVRKLDAGWVERCSQIEIQSQRLSSDSGFESMESTIHSTSVIETSKENNEVGDSSDDDEVIGGSDNELDESSQSKLSLSFLSKKRKLNDSNASNTSATAEEETVESQNNRDNKRMKINSYDEWVKKEVVNEVKTVIIDPYELVEETVKKPNKSEVKNSTSLKKEILERKMKLGTLNENYVKINIKKKVFVRGKKNFNYSKHKKQQWKNKKKNADDKEIGGIIHCFKCGDAGHYARYCQKMMGDKLLDDDGDEEEDCALPTLEEAEAMAQEKAEKVHKRKNILHLIPSPQEEENELPIVEPVYRLNEDGSLIDTPEEVYDTLNKFGHLKFRQGQEEAVMRILSGQSTLVTISTGGGKSLCYQLPAYMYASKRKCITLVVSPLVSLMEDQVSGSSSFFKLGCLHTNQTAKQREAVIEDAKSGKLDALLVSPEAVVAGENSTGLGVPFKQLPPIAFACIDEVHCVSQWSHNFRPSYLMICKVLKEKLGVRTILGLTATATKTTINGIVNELGILSDQGVIKDTPLPDNLCLSISQDENKDKALLELLNSPRFRDSNATLIYCTRRDECERLAVLIRTLHNDPTKPMNPKSKRISWNAESYHAGMSASRRKQVQRAFMSGNLRIVVATVAFGMGINKRDIRAVIHYNMPKDFESYVQEVGRAGRDGMLAHCHLFLDSKGRDVNELRRHIYSNSVDRHVIRKLLQRVFVECKCGKKELPVPCAGHEVAFDSNDTVTALDIPEENIYTLLCYLELHPKKLIKVLTPVYTNCKVQSYKGLKAIHAAAKKCPPLAVACAMKSNSDEDKSASLQFNVVDVARIISWDSGVVKKQLKNTEWDKTKEDKWKKTGIVVEFSNLGFRVCSRGDMTPSELDEALDYLIGRVEEQEKRSADQLVVTFSAFSHFSSSSLSDCLDGYDNEKSDCLKKTIRKYFETEELPDEIPVKVFQEEEFDESVVASDVRNLVCTYRDNSFNGRAVARIFHGIQSPNYPASVWFRCRYWRNHLDKDFNKINRIATREILRLK